MRAASISFNILTLKTSSSNSTIDFIKKCLSFPKDLNLYNVRFVSRLVHNISLKVSSTSALFKIMPLNGTINILDHVDISYMYTVVYTAKKIL